MREYVFPLSLTLFLMVAGIGVALQPVMDANYVHPVGLALTGMTIAMAGAVLATIVGGMAIRARSRA